MTGEITLRGNVIAVGGLTEKSLAARRAGLEVMLLPRANEKDIAEMPEDVREGLDLVLVESMDQVLETALRAKPTPLTAEPVKTAGGGKEPEAGPEGRTRPGFPPPPGEQPPAMANSR